MNERLSGSEWYVIESNLDSVGFLLREITQDGFATELDTWGGVTYDHLTERDGVLAKLDEAIDYLTGLRKEIKEGPQ